MDSEAEFQFDPKPFLKQLTQHPGIYQMLDAEGKVLYVGKAKNLKKRVASYFRSSGLPPKTQSLVARVDRVEVTVTKSEMEALVLEQNLIKSQRPPYNILLRDDKSYPYILMTTGEEYPRLSVHRGGKKKQGQYFGPFPNVGAVRESLNFLQKTFRVRQCEDSVFRNRSRPCLQYQIKRCSGPCVGMISAEEYGDDVRHTEMFLKGQNDYLMGELANAMDAASQSLAFEKAALYRDQIAALRGVQADWVVEAGSANIDIVAAVCSSGTACVHVLYVRQGRILGSRSYFPQERLEAGEKAVLSAFLPQFYLGSRSREIPREIVLSHPAEELDLLAQAINSHRGLQVKFVQNVRTHRASWLKMAATAARHNLKSYLIRQQSLMKQFEALQEALNLDEVPNRLECFDISHSSGELTVASCVVFNQEGPIKSDYRRFNIEDIQRGDDYAAMEQALTRRYTRIQKGEGKLPDVLLIDGGKGQLSQAEAVMAELGINDIVLVGVAKGTSRKAGFETLYLSCTGHELVLQSDAPALHLIQQVRDEAHRFAVTGHKQRRDKKRRTSTLEGIPGIGAKRRKELLRHFGGLQEVAKASIDELEKVPNISKKMAEEVYSALHSE